MPSAPSTHNDGRVLVLADDEIVHLRRLASDGLRDTAFAEFPPRDPKEPAPQPETLARRAFCKRILNETPEEGARG